MTILFRSKSHNTHQIFGSVAKIKRRGTDWSDIGNYQESDDVRDIIWRKSTENTLYKKQRVEDAGLRILILKTHSYGDNFSISSSKESRHFFDKKVSDTIKLSAFHAGYEFEQLEGTELDALFEKILKKERKNSLIFVICHLDAFFNLPISIKKLAGVNDIILLVTAHPFELNPTLDTALLEGLTLSKTQATSYKNELSQKIKTTEKSLLSMGISSIILDTNTDIEKRLNYFFKERLLHG